MQSLHWYFWRLKSMSPGEILWRASSVIQGISDRARFSLGHVPRGAALTRTKVQQTSKPGFRVSDVRPGAWHNSQGEAAEWLQRLKLRADEIMDHRLTFFDLDAHHIGSPIDWHRDHSAGVATPKTYAPSIDYRDFQVAGDCKLVWEPSRHHHLVVLARAYRATGERRYAEAVAAQLRSWLHDNPYPIGMNWRSGLELGVRLVNWVWAVDLVRDSGVLAGDLWCDLVESVYLHCWENARKYSQGSSSNNHLVGEAAGVYIACAYFDQMPNASRWREQARAILTREITRQSYDDGCTREHAVGYQMFVLEFYIACGLAGRWHNEEFSSEYWQRAEKMTEFLGLLHQGGDTLPFIGDYDDGYVLDLGREPRDPRDLLAIGAVLFQRADFKYWAGHLREPVSWFLGKEGVDAYSALRTQENSSLRSTAFISSGYYLLQTGLERSPERISILFDCAALGFGSIAAHGHADALSFALRAFGTDVFVDPGTYDYYTHREWRNHFRSTSAHNTVEIDDLDQSTMLGNFMWGKRANARCLSWEPTDHGGTVCGEHDGYQRLSSPLTHRRTLSLNDKDRSVCIRDELVTEGLHRVAVYFHLSEHCIVLRAEANHCEISVRDHRVTLLVDPRLSLEVAHGRSDPIGGWISRGYHHKIPIHTLIARGVISGTTQLTSQINL